MMNRGAQLELVGQLRDLVGGLGFLGPLSGGGSPFHLEDKPLGRPPEFFEILEIDVSCDTAVAAPYASDASGRS